jgi:adenylosuccinate synthase
VVIDVEALLGEIQKLKASGYLKNPKQLLISENATIILPFHKALDAAREASLATGKIGTTGKGIGPAYEDRASRRALLFGDIFNSETLKAKLELALNEKNLLLEKVYNQRTFAIEPLMQDLARLAAELSPYRCKDVSLVVHKQLKAGKRVLFEGAQGTLLDINYGTYPFVTSSSTLAGAACTGTGVGPTSIKNVIGIFKAYATRVGGGPFPTELANEVGAKLQKDGNEFGSTTGRARRCGWLDLPALKYAIRINGITNLALMKLDVLSGHERIGVCTGYKVNGELIQEWPGTASELDKVEPVIEMLPGWKEDISRLMRLKDLPKACTNYIDFIGNQVATPIDVISVGPGREQTLWVKPLFS